KATFPSSFVPRQLYVDGKIATRARSSSINRTDMNMQTSGWSFTNSSLSFLNSLKQPARADLHAIGSWTDRYSPIQSVSNGTVTMVQPAWDGNTWGWDVIKCPTGGSMCNGPYRNGPIYVENDYSLLDQAGEWYQDTTAGALYYIPLSGQDMSKADVELPQLELLLAVGGACPSGTPTGGADCVQPNGSSPTVAVAYAAPAGGDPYAQPTHDITFSGLTFSHTSWLEPKTTSRRAGTSSVQGRITRAAANPPCSSRCVRTGVRCRARSRYRTHPTSPSRATASSRSAVWVWASATTPTRTRPASASVQLGSTWWVACFRRSPVAAF